MFYYLSELRDIFFPFNIFRYITFRAGLAAITTFVLCLILGPFFIKRLRKLKVQEIAKRTDCPDLDQFQNSKEGTPTMGGVFIVGSILFSVFLWADLSNKFVLLTMFTCLWLAILGWVDDYTKLTQQGKKRGLSARTKLLWEILLGCLVGAFVYFDPQTSTTLDFPFLKNSFLSRFKRDNLQNYRHCLNHKNTA